MPFGTPGGDVQCQSMVQLFLNMVEFGMGNLCAIEIDRQRGVLRGGADPRREAYAMGR